jgi:hypothetical protein
MTQYVNTRFACYGGLGRRLSVVFAGLVAALLLAPFEASANDDGTPAWAVVNAGGALVRGSNGASVAKLGTGRFEVTFAKNVANCAYTATIGDTGNALQYYPGEVFTAGGHASAKGVYVETKNPGGGLSDYPFHLSASC